MWDGFWILSNKRVWEGIPANLREIVERNINEEAIRQRAEVEHMNATLQSELQKRGLEFHNVDNAAFRDKLVAAGFYTEWKKRYGDEAWALLEGTTGKLG
jgi:TRAP-type C4-dicarboxylate transport system substrate-binding protein